MINGVPSVMYSGVLLMLKLSVVTWVILVLYKQLVEHVSPVCNIYYQFTILLCINYLDFGQGIGPIHRTQVLCQGFEPNLFTCPSQQDTSSCDHSMDAGVICISELL